jgi:hypothetical protein
MKISPRSLVGLLSLCIVATVHADVLFDNTSGSIIGGWGYFNPGAAWGDEITLSGSATVTSFAFDLGDVFSGYGNGTLTLAFYNVDAGTDALVQTGDDKIGSLIGTYSQAVSLTSNTRYTMSGFSIDVPVNFIYTVTNGSGLSYVLEATKDAATTGTSSNSNIWANFSTGGLPVGTQSNSGYASGDGNNQVLLQGTMTAPEPGTLYLMSGAAVLSLLFRLRRLRR